MKSIASTKSMPILEAMHDAAAAPMRFVHPRATRDAALGAAHVGYELARGRRRTIGFVVGAEGLSVRAPRWVALRDIDRAVQEKADWIVRKLGEARQRQARANDARIDWRDGVVLPFLGAPLQVRLDPDADANPHVVGFDDTPDPDAAEGTDAGATEGAGMVHVRTLTLALARDAAPSQIRGAVHAWLLRQARCVFVDRLDSFAARLDVRWTRLTLSNAATRWGSASSDGSIRLNWRLIHLRVPLIDYVVAHELGHLRVMDHSPRFWATVRGVVPDCDALRAALRSEVIPRWD